MNSKDNVDDFTIDRNIRRLYKSCMNEGLIEKRGTDPLKEKLKELGGWPVLEGDQWNGSSSFKWYDQVLKMDSLGSYHASLSIISYYIKDHPNEKGKKIIHLNMPFLFPYHNRRPYVSRTIPCTGNVEDLDRRSEDYLVGEMVELAVKLGANNKTAKIEMEEARKFEVKLFFAVNCDSKRLIIDDFAIHDDWLIIFEDAAPDTNITATLGNVVSSLTNSSTGSLPGYPPSWTKFVSTWLSRHNISINDDTPVILKNLDYFIKVSELLSEYENNPRAVANLLVYRFAFEEIQNLDGIAIQARSIANQPDDISNKMQNENYTLLQQNYQMFVPMVRKIRDYSRNEFCIYDILGFGKVKSPGAFGYYKLLKRGMIGPISSMYVRRYAPPNLKPGSLEMTKYIRIAFKKNIEELDWMDAKTKQKALIKLDAMRQLIAYADELTNKTFMDGFFEGNETDSNLTLKSNLINVKMWLEK